jgi:hypothetical protein
MGVKIAGLLVTDPGVILVYPANLFCGGYTIVFL